MRLIIDLVYRGKKWRAVPKSSSRDIQDMPKKKKLYTEFYLTLMIPEKA